jgi:16S rRNA (cytidine1402-2'-O)-methyltransferase
VSLSGGLVVIGTPIGNLDDLAPRAAAALRDADVVACEDTRRSAVLLRHAGADTPMLPLHAHNEASREGALVARMRAGETVALVSDAGMPLVSDPGARLVRAAVEAGLPVTVVPGPSAVTTALALSGLSEGGGFLFAGFAPRAAGERRAFAERLDALDVPAVVFESPNRLPGLLRDLAARWPDRPAAVLRELTKLHEQALRGTLAELAERLDAPPRGEVVLVLAPAAAPAPGDGDEERLRDALSHMLDAGLGAGRAADLAASLGLARRNAAYRAAVGEAERRRSAT